ncbi:sporulation integral membrane protein YtvI [Radiobacillus kanasensis]|uniref:sporulation integral membrane protein YtvI n=1 Tax=Radiobacillus kanasensis TaxID=2844358 RepID=UPI001E586C5E|nr:sporulation integral membrane protein YtvI [Radiobacillus kanasensis]UFU01400.1 sporulation integral membrane protein YtvI [Radiobacillus kanasensis]
MITKQQVQRFLFVCGIILTSYFLFVSLAQYTYPFIIAIFFAYLLNPVVDWLSTSFKLPRGLAVFLSIVFILTVITAIISILVVELINGTAYLANNLPESFKMFVQYMEQWITNEVMPIYEKLASIYQSLEPSQQKAILDHVKQTGENIASTGADTLQNFLQEIPTLLSKLPSYITVLIFSLMGTFFISKDWPTYKLMLRRKTSSNVRQSGVQVTTGLKRAFTGYIKAQFTLISITACIVLIGLFILRVDYAVTIAFLTGIVDILPYVGTGIVFIPWILYCYFTGNMYLTIGLSILFVTVVVQRQLMEPKILSQSIGVNPLATLVALFVGFQLWGFSGLIIGPTLAVVGNTLYQSGLFHSVAAYIKGEES